MRARAVHSLRLSILGLILLVVFSLCLLVPVKADPSAILKVSLPDGTYVGPDADPWLSECWLLNLTGTSQTFTVRINNTSAAKRSYDTHVVIALNDVGYNNLQSLVVNSTSVPKSAFKYGTPTPYNLWTWPSGDVYPTWFNDTYVNVGTIPRKGYKEVVVSATFSNATGIRMHFDAYGSKSPGTPTKTGDITHNAISEDSTVLLQPGPAGQPPIAEFFFTPFYPNTNEMVIFNASESYDPDGYIVSYSWDFGDGTPVVIESDPIANHTYTAFGNYTVTLTVTDNDGLTDNATSPLSVREHPVAAFVFSPSDPLEHEVITFDASASTPDGGVIISYEWNFGDGNITTVSEPVINHTYSTFGNYTVILNVTDSEGKWDTESKPITVEALPIADFWWSPVYPTPCKNVTFDASDSTPDGGVIISYAWNFGDGTPVVIESDNVTTHHYTINGSFTVTLNITDSEGRWDTESKIITVKSCRYYLTVKTDPEGITTIPGEGWYDNSTNVDLTAPEFVPNATGINSERYRFTHWDVDGLNVTGNPITIHMDANHTATAHYVLQYFVNFSQIGVDIDFNGTVITINGIDYDRSNLPYGNWWDEGSSINFSFVSPLPVNANKRYVWDYTSGASSNQNDTLLVSPLSIFGVTGHYKTQYYLTLTTNPSGVTTPSGEGWHDAGTYAPISTNDTVDIVPGSSRYKFFEWTTANMSEMTDPASPSTTVYMDEPKTVTANYKIQYLITVTASPNSALGGTFEVTYVQCGTTYSNVQKTTEWSDWADASTDVTVSAPQNIINDPPGTRYKFDSYTPSASVYMDQDRTIILTYKTQYRLTVLTNPSGLSPQPTRNPAGETASENSWWYDESTSVQLTAQNVDRYRFVRWIVNNIYRPDGVTSISVEMDEPKVAVAYYMAEVVGGRSVTMKSPLLTTWISLNTIFVCAVFILAACMKHRKRKTS